MEEYFGESNNAMTPLFFTMFFYHFYHRCLSCNWWGILILVLTEISDLNYEELIRILI